MKTLLRTVQDGGQTYDALMFVCPGCAATRDGYEGLHMLPVNSTVSDRPSWTWDGNLEQPTLEPSILTRSNWAGVDWVCHSFLRGGRFEFLADSTHSLAGQTVDLPDLPDWAADD